jgi:hypothetical protein
MRIGFTPVVGKRAVSVINYYPGTKSSTAMNLRWQRDKYISAMSFTERLRQAVAVIFVVRCATIVHICGLFDPVTAR